MLAPAQHALWSSTWLKGACNERGRHCVNTSMTTLPTDRLVWDKMACLPAGKRHGYTCEWELLREEGPRAAFPVCQLWDRKIWA